MKKRIPQNIKHELYRQVKELREAGNTYKSIGVKLGISDSLAWQIYKKYQPDFKYEGPDTIIHNGRIKKLMV
ncbi:MAG: hypothetical protein ACYSU6_01345 [Planctomycetota bacterium]|jgi:hypothetical protein